MFRSVGCRAGAAALDLDVASNVVFPVTGASRNAGRAASPALGAKTTAGA